MLWGLLAASTIAILTTVGIVLSMLFQTITLLRKRVADEFLLRHRLGSALRRRRFGRQPRASSA